MYILAFLLLIIGIIKILISLPSDETFFEYFKDIEYREIIITLFIICIDGAIEFGAGLYLFIYGN